LRVNAVEVTVFILFGYGIKQLCKVSIINADEPMLWMAESHWWCVYYIIFVRYASFFWSNASESGYFCEMIESTDKRNHFFISHSW